MSIPSPTSDPADRLIWLDGEILPAREARVPVLSPTAQFGLNVFEGIRAYYCAITGDLNVFRLDDHLRRLKRSQRLLGISEKFTPSELRTALFDVVRANGYREDIALRMTIFVGGEGSWRSCAPVCCFIAPIAKPRTDPALARGLRCRVSAWRRIGDNTLSPRVKCGANYINSRMAQLDAERDGYDSAILQNENGSLAEGPGSCLFLVKNGALLTPALSDSILESITRDTVLRLARRRGITTVERPISRTELYSCDEAFLCGSAMEIAPIAEVDGYPLPARELTLSLARAYLDLVTGAAPADPGDLTPIPLA